VLAGRGGRTSFACAMTNPVTPSLRMLAVKAAAWYGATRLWGQFVSWAVTILLARLLLPLDYGLFAITLSVLALVELLQEFGLGTALIQRQDVTRQQLNAVFWIVALTSLLLTAATFVASGTISQIYAEPSLVWPLRLMCLTFLLNSLGVVPYSLLTKAINLRQRSLAEAYGTTAAALVALTLAYLGYGVGALVIGQVVRAVILNVSLSFFAGWLPDVRVDFGGTRALLTFGMGIAGSNVIGTATTATTTFLIARLLSGTAVGLYAMAQSLTDAPIRLTAAILNQVSLPMFSKLQHDPASLSASFLKMSKYLVMLTLPLQIGLALVAPDLIPLLLASKWEAVTFPFQVLCLESSVTLFTITCLPLLTARGRVSLLFKVAVYWFAALTAATIAGIPFGLAGVMIARLASIAPIRAFMLMATLRELELAPAVYLRRLASPLCAVALMALAVGLLQRSWPVHANQLGLLVASIAAGAITYVGALLLLDRTLVSEVRMLVRDLFAVSRA
jgi:O-antigen/teichoic acid export membrane protein